MNVKEIKNSKKQLGTQHIIVKSNLSQLKTLSRKCLN